MGALSALAFAPDPFPAWFLPWLQIAGLAFLFYCLLGARHTKQAIYHSLFFGFGHFSTGLYWVFISLHRYGGLAEPLAGGAVALLGLGLAVYLVVFTLLARWLAPYPSDEQAAGLFYNAFVWASAWALVEWLRGTLFTGLPWLNSAYAHVDGFLAGWAPLVGVYGLNWLIGFLACSLALVVRAQGTPNDRSAAFAVLCAAALFIAGWGLQHRQWSQPIGDPLLVRLTQGNIPQSEKFDPQLMQQGLDTYMQLANLPPKTAGAEPELIVLPETVMVLFQDAYPGQVWLRWQSIAKAHQASLLMGAPIKSSSKDDTDQSLHYTNSALLVSGDTPLERLFDGQADGRYDKHHLVPFGEFIPAGFRWFVNALNIPLGDFDRGELGQTPFTINDQFVAPNICYEDVFGEEIIAAVRSTNNPAKSATILVNISNLGWFGDSFALGQHLQISRMRAIETARPMLRSTNTGMTAAIDPNGAIRAVLPAHSVGVLDVEVQGTSGITPYVQWGNWPVIVWSLLFLLAALARRMRK